MRIGNNIIYCTFSYSYCSTDNQIRVTIAGYYFEVKTFNVIGLQTYLRNNKITINYIISVTSYQNFNSHERRQKRAGENIPEIGNAVDG